MKRTQQILSFLLALCMVFSAGFPIFVRAEEQPALVLEASNRQLLKGETVVLSLRGEFAADLRGAGITLTYDPEVLELVEEESTAQAPFAVSTPIRQGQDTLLRVSFPPQDTAVPVAKGQNIAAITFRALRSCDSTEVKVTNGFFFDGALEEISVALPDSLELKIEKPASNGIYMVKLPERMAAMEGDTLRLPVFVDGTGELTEYHDFDLQFAFDPQMLQFVEAVAEGAEVEVRNGSVHVIAYGEGRAVGTVAMELIFQVLQTGENQLTLTSCRVDHAKNAVDSDIPEAHIENGITLIYPAESADPTEPTEPTDPSAPTEPTEPTEPTDPSAPTEPTEPTDPSAPMEPTDPTEPTDPSAPTEPTVPTEPTDPSAPTEPTEPVDPTEPTESPRPTEPDKPVVSDTVSVVFTGSGAADANGSDTARMGRDYIFRIRKEEGYAYTVTAQVYGEGILVNVDPDSGSCTVPGRYITGTLTIRIEKKPLVEVSAYLTMNERTMYLILYNGNLAPEYVPRYDGQNMYWSARYQAYAWLVESPDADVVIREIALEKIRVVKGQPSGQVNYSGNVDLSLHMDVTDVELVWAMYNAEYTLEEMEILKFLNGDVNADKRLDVRDAAWITKKIYGRGG